MNAAERTARRLLEDDEIDPKDYVMGLPDTLADLDTMLKPFGFKRSRDNRNWEIQRGTRMLGIGASTSPHHYLFVNYHAYGLDNPRWQNDKMWPVHASRVLAAVKKWLRLP